VAATSAPCVQTALPSKTITALEGTPFNYSFGITGAVSYTLDGNTRPPWLGEDLSSTAASNLYGLPTGSVSQTYQFILNISGAEGTYYQKLTLKYVAKPVMDPQLANKIIDIYYPDVGSRTYVTSAPLWQLNATNAPTAYNSSGLPSGISLNRNRLVGKFNLSAIDSYPKEYAVAFWATNAAGAGEAIEMTIRLHEYLEITTAVAGQSYCFNFPSELERTGETLIDYAPSWLTFRSSDILAIGECGLSGTPSGDVSKDENLLVRFLYPFTYKSLYVKFNYESKSHISYPVDQSVITIYSPDFAEDGSGREWDIQNPLLAVLATNNPSELIISGLPEGLRLDNGKVVGKITAPAGDYIVSLFARNTAGDGPAKNFTLRLLNAPTYLPEVKEGQAGDARRLRRISPCGNRPAACAGRADRCTGVFREGKQKPP